MTYGYEVPDRVTISNSLATKLRAERERAGLTQRTVGDAIGRTGSAISDIERKAQQTMERTDLFVVCDLLGIDPGDYGIAASASEAGDEWIMPEEFNRVSRGDRIAAQEFLSWVFRTREASE